MVRPTISELKKNIGSLVTEKYQLRSALEGCISYLGSEGGMTTRHPIMKAARKAIRDTDFVKISVTKR